MIKSLYIHIPFCKSKCSYCNFCSFSLDENTQKKYFAALKKEICSKADKKSKIQTIYFGGGTPSLVKSSYIEQILCTIKQNFDCESIKEISIECNPNSITKEKLLHYKDMGINRISLGVQSLNDKVLKKLGRTHTKKDVFKALENIKTSGIKNYSVDLIIGLKQQNKMQLNNTIKKLVKKGISHLSCYMLIVEDDTPIQKNIKKGLVRLQSEDKCVELYESVYKTLKKYKFERYEVSNFCKKGKECLHNALCWQGEEFFGFGLSSHSFYNNSIVCNTTNLEKYLSLSEYFDVEDLETEQICTNYVMLALRTKNGIDISKLYGFGFDILKEKKNELEKLKNQNLIEIDENNIKVKDNAFCVLNLILLELVP